MVWGFLTVRGGVDPRKLGFLPRMVKFQRYGTASGPRMRPYPPDMELAQHTNLSHSEIGRWGWDFHTVRRGINQDVIRVRSRFIGVVDVWVDSDPAM